MIPKMRDRRAAVGRISAPVLAAAVVVGCSGGAAPPPSASSPAAASASGVPFPSGARPTFQPAPSLPGGIASVPPSGGEGEVPAAVMDAARADLRTRVGAAADAAEVVVSRAVVWSDGSLGCPLPGRSYIQALVPGWWIVLEADGRRFDYRAGRSGDVRLCDRPFPAASATLGGSASG